MPALNRRSFLNVFTAAGAVSAAGLTAACGGSGRGQRQPGDSNGAPYDLPATLTRILLSFAANSAVVSCGP